MRKPSVFLIAFALSIAVTLSARAQSPGDTIGFMQFDNQSWTSIGHKIAIDNIGGTHFVWHYPFPGTTEWNVKYAYLDNSGIKTYYDLGEGEYPQVAVDSDNQPGIAFDHGDDWDMIYWTPDGQSLLPDMGMWPMVAIDRHDRVHIAYFWYGGGREGVRNIGYVRSVDGGQTWTEPVKVDSALCPSFMITASPVSDKVAVVYTNQISWEHSVGVSYIQSLDGLNWDWENGEIDVTQYPDSCFCGGNDLDAVYDFNDNLHIVWNALCLNCGMSDWVYIRHYDAASGQTSEVTSLPPWTSECTVGHWGRVVCKMSIASAEYPLLVATYTRFSPKDCSWDLRANGEICMKYSRDDGQTWFGPMNLTFSPSPNCNTGECNSDHWSSLAEKVDSFAYLFYVNDKDGGDRQYGEGSFTINPMLYYRIPFNPLGISEMEGPLPDGISLSQNYPNPFNAQTTIQYSLSKQSEITIDIFDILGRKIETIAEGIEPAGNHQTIWDANVQSSGIYFYRIKTGDKVETKKMVLMK